MTIPNNSCQWEKRNEKEKLRNKDRFNGARYGFRGTEHSAPDNIIPQLTGMYPFPKDDDQAMSPTKGYEDPN